MRLLNDAGGVVSFIPYKNVLGLKNLLPKYNSYSSIVIANGEDIPEIEDLFQREKKMFLSFVLMLLKTVETFQELKNYFLPTKRAIFKTTYTLNS